MPTGTTTGETPEQRKARMHALAKRSAEVRRQQKEERAQRSAQGAGSRMAEPFVPQPSDASASAFDPASELQTLAIAELERILRSRKALNADKIRAAEQLRRYREAAASTAGDSSLVELRRALEMVPVEQRVEVLRLRLGRQEGEPGEAEGEEEAEHAEHHDLDPPRTAATR